MKKIIIIAAAIGMAACNSAPTVPADEVERQRDSLQTIIDNQSEELNDFMASFSQIQEGLQQMSEAEGRVTVANSDPELTNSKETIRENMEFLSSTMQQQRDMIAKLREKLQTSSLNVDKMKQALDNLQSQLDTQTARVQELQAQLAERDETIALQGATIAQQDEAITRQSEEIEKKAATVAAQDKALNEAWYVFGTKSELKAQKIIDSGELLKSDRFNKDYFTKVDIRNTRDIKLYSKNAKLLTSHPDGSYILKADANGEYALKITDPQKFWSLSRYLVIQVK